MWCGVVFPFDKIKKKDGAGELFGSLQSRLFLVCSANRRLQMLKKAVKIAIIAS